MGKSLSNVIFLALGLSLGLPQLSFAACANDIISLQIPQGKIRFQTEVAETVEEKSQGLMNRDSLPERAGMLFVYDAPQRVAFWMRNTLIPLDMIFADETGEIQKIHHHAIPLDETPIFGGDNIKFVFEINAGLAQKYGISQGALIQHPAIGKHAAWPCE